MGEMEIGITVTLNDKTGAPTTQIKGNLKSMGEQGRTSFDMLTGGALNTSEMLHIMTGHFTRLMYNIPILLAVYEGFVHLQEAVKDYNKGLEELAKGHDTVAVRAKEDLATEKAYNDQAEELKLTLASVAKEGFDAFLEANTKTSAELRDTEIAMIRSKDAAHLLGTALGDIVKGWLVEIPKIPAAIHGLADEIHRQAEDMGKMFGGGIIGKGLEYSIHAVGSAFETMINPVQTIKNLIGLITGEMTVWEVITGRIKQSTMDEAEFEQKMAEVRAIQAKKAADAQKKANEEAAKSGEIMTKAYEQNQKEILAERTKAEAKQKTDMEALFQFAANNWSKIGNVFKDEMRGMGVTTATEAQKMADSYKKADETSAGAMKRLEEEHEKNVEAIKKTEEELQKQGGYINGVYNPWNAYQDETKKAQEGLNTVLLDTSGIFQQQTQYQTVMGEQEKKLNDAKLKDATNYYQIVGITDLQLKRQQLAGLVLFQSTFAKNTEEYKLCDIAIQKLKADIRGMTEETFTFGTVAAQVLSAAISKAGEYFTTLIAGNSKLAGMMGGVGGGIGTSIFTNLAKDMGQFGQTIMPVLGGIIGSIGGALAGKLIEAIMGAPWRDIGKAVTKQFGFGVTDEMSKKILELSKSIGQNRAIAQMMGQIVGDITTPGSFSAAASAIGQLVGEMQKGLITVDDAAKGIGDTFTKMAAYAGDSIDKTMTLAVIQVRNSGLEVKEIMDYVKNAEEGAASGLTKWGEALATLYDKGAISGAEYQKQLKELRGYQQQTADNMVRNGSTLSEAYSKVGIKLDEIKTAQLQLVDAENEYYAGIGKAGDTQDKFYSESIKFQGDIIKNYDAMIKGGLNQNQAIEAIAPSLKTIVALQKIYGFTIDAGTQKLIDQAQQQGLMAKDAMSAQNMQITLLEKIAEKLGADIPDAIAKFVRGLNDANAAADDLSKTINKIGIPKYGGSGGKGIPEIGAQGGFHGYSNREMLIHTHPDERIDIWPKNEYKGDTKNEFNMTMNLHLSGDVKTIDAKILAKDLMKQMNEEWKTKYASREKSLNAFKGQ